LNFLNPSGRAPIVGDVTAFDCTVTDETWPWAEKNADAIAKHWAQAIAEKPSMFDGEVVIATEVGIEQSRVVSTHAVVRFSAFHCWQKSGFPRADAFNLFGAGMVVTKDGAALLGKMAAHTSNAGLAYFPCGTPDRDDIKNGKLDIEGSIIRELEEETGLGSFHLRPADQRWISWDGALFCCARRFDTDLTAAEAEKIVAAYLASQAKPELEKVILVKSLDDLVKGEIPAYAVALLGQVLA
jgi:hypothetical protein